MKSPRWLWGATMLLSLALWIPPTRLVAQGVTTGAISGTVTDAAGKPVESAQVQVVNRSPQVIIPTTGGPSAGGQYNRYNNFTIDGANQNDRFNLNSTGGLPGGAGNGRIISQEAVKEFRVLMSPTDVRQANFTGMLVNAVTKGGTNEWHGGAIYNFRNENLSATNFRTTALDVKQYGFQLGGPIIRDRLQIFVAPEWQQRTTAAAGPFVGQTENASRTALTISPDSIAAGHQSVRSDPRFGFDPGTAGFVPVDNPLTNLFGRIDFEINPTHRLVLRQLVNRTESFAFSRGTQAFQTSPANQNTGFRLGSNAFNGVNTNNSTVAQLYSNFSPGTSNQFLAGFNQIRDKRGRPPNTPPICGCVAPPGATRT